MAVNTELPHQGMFNGQPVDIPTWDIGTIISAHGTGPDHNILQHFIYCGSQMNMAVGVRRPIMENILGLALSSFPQLSVTIFLTPLFLNQRFPLGQIASHGKLSLW